ncbi:FadR/GntR family transcriptional regulator [Zhihengliuella sp. ISTPL4]|uniref:FadR/GntR family transcriptional regulator n=1 Tax=Zhihengliuella sp. ISTPL4 TaxID=2058657 RepID=UPI000C7D119B|nr:FCD domain-containing protein [Zhihengliuella sp. ISTPL4]
MTRSASQSLEPRELELLLLIAAAAEPLGARELRRRLADGGRVSESTMNRLLRRLDEQGLTRSQAGRGRVLSPAGRALADQATREQRWHDNLSQLEIKTLGDVRDLVVARRALEREIVRSAALSAEPSDVMALRRYLVQHEDSIESERDRRVAAVEFHRQLARSCPNRMLRASAMVLFDPRFDVLEQVLDIVTAGRGRTEASPHEHDAIVDAIEARDPDAAEAAMLQHLDRLSEDLSAETSASTALAIELFLRSQPAPRI